MNPVLHSYGWDDAWAAAFAPHAAAGYEPARVVVELRRHYYAVQTADGEVLGELTGKFHHAADRDARAYPAVGDWVAVQIPSDRQRAQIHALLPRRSCFSRQAAGERQVEQIVATNIDTVFLVSGLDANYNAKRIQRFFVAARESGAQPVIILNKSDLCEDAEKIRAEIELLVPGIPVALTSTYTRKGLKALTERSRSSAPPAPANRRSSIVSSKTAKRCPPPRSAKKTAADATRPPAASSRRRPPVPS
jgi:ribosome biogenesis GTPase / thiamine phosphate phosphatase